MGPYHFDTDTDPGCEKNSLGIRMKAKKDSVPGNLKILRRKNAHFRCLVRLYYYYLTITFL